jgi:hypothetical protein
MEVNQHLDTPLSTALDRRPTMDLLVPLTQDLMAALGAFWRMAADWGLSETEETRLLNAPHPSYAQWKHGTVSVVCGLDVQRLDSLLSIHDTWMLQHTGEDDVRHWLRAPNTEAPFEGRAPLQFLFAAQTASLRQVARPLEASSC